MEAARGKLLYLDEVLTMSARMAAASGNPDWETRYWKFEPQLDQAINEGIRLEPDASFGDAARIDAANDALVGMHHRALDLVRQARNADAHRLLSSPEYEAQKRIYGDGVEALDQHLAQVIASSRRDVVRAMGRHAIAAVVVAALLILGWSFTFRMQRRQQASIAESNRRLDQKTADLLEANSQLDRKVSERTRELEDSALASMNMMEDAVMQREKAEHGLEKLKHEEVQLVQARDEALHAMGARSQFLANMSHEIRTPMNGVLGMTEVLRESVLTPQQRDATETIHYSAQSLLTIINDILDFSRIDAGALRMEMLDFDLPDVVQQSVATCAEIASGKGLKLTSVFDIQGLPVLRGDPGRLRQVLVNLIGNAVKFTEHGDVLVSVTLQRRSMSDVAVRFAIRDTGMGIASDVQKRLFQKFMQSDSSMTRRHGGSGLGLAISKQLVGMMGGEIGVESELGKGATFWFTARFDTSTAHLPAAVGLSTALAAVDAGEVVPPGQWRVLVADDNQVNQMVARNQLLKLGLRPTFVDDGRQAVEALRHEHYDLVFMDCQMPELDGYAATAEIRGLPKRAERIWIIAMTAHAMGGDRARCLAAGMDDYLAKPVTTQALREAMERFEKSRSDAKLIVA